MKILLTKQDCDMQTRIREEESLEGSRRKFVEKFINRFLGKRIKEDSIDRILDMIEGFSCMPIIYININNNDEIGSLIMDYHCQDVRKEDNYVE